MKHVHLIAVCGTAMSALAGMFKESGYRVTGSDQNVYPPMSDILREQGVELRIGYKKDNISDNPCLVIVGNAVSRNNPEVEALLDTKIPYLSMPQAISKYFFNDKKIIVVTGTHGKTTTSSIIAWVLENSRREPSFLVGGIPKNFGKNYKLGKGNFFVIEGDEYDTAFFDKDPKFFHYLPDVAVLTSVEFDHADIYADFSKVENAFKKFIQKIPNQSKLIACKEDENVMRISREISCEFETYGTDLESDWITEVIERQKEKVFFKIKKKENIFGKGITNLIGRHNLMNLLGAIAALSSLGLSAEEITAGIQSFQGVKRRQEVVGEINGITVFDDFAHHPTAVRETIRAFKESYPQKRLWAIFEPRSNTSRRSVFEKEYGEAFLDAEKIIIAGVYNSGLLDEKIRFSPQRVVDNLVNKGKEAFYIQKVEDIISYLAGNLKKNDIVLIMSNGGFGGIHRKLIEQLRMLAKKY